MREEGPLPGPPARLSPAGRALALAAAFLGWLFAGALMSTTTQAMRPAALDLLGRAGRVDLARFQELNRRMQEQPRRSPREVLPADDAARLEAWRGAAQAWFAYYQCALLFGAAAGGLLFGRLGDRFGRSAALAGSVLCYSLLSGVAYFVQTPLQLLVVWFLACLGVGGVWPNGVALVAETWSGLSRPLVAGVMGTAANVGIFALATLATRGVSPEDWRWVMLVDAAPVVLGLGVLAFVPESPRWLAARARGAEAGGPAAPLTEVFRPPHLRLTLVGILLATVPLIGGWGSANWMVPWAAEARETAASPDPSLEARVGQVRALTGTLGSLLGGWVAHLLGRRRSYFLVSLAALGCAQYAFWWTWPTDRSFLLWVGGLGFFSGVYFGWLPLFLPELFPTPVRSTGSGVSFNFGRVLTAVTVFATGAVTAQFGGDYARVGRVTSLVYALGALAAWLAPDTGKEDPLTD
jgi:MFS family permease